MYIQHKGYDIPCTHSTAGSLSRKPTPRIPTEQVTFVLLYSSVARICKEYLLPSSLVVISVVVSSSRVIPLISQPNNPVLILQLKVAVDPSVALTDVGVMMKAEIHMNQKITM